MKKNKPNVNKRLIARRLTSLISLAFSATFIISIMRSGLLPLKYMLSIIVSLIVLNVLIASLLTPTKRGKRAVMAGLVTAVIVIIGSIGGTYGIYSSLALLDNITDNTAVQKKSIDNTKPFNIYISGIDTYGDITTVSRSDVNIVATIDPANRHMLLTTIPRDSYVPIADGGNDQNDKLTHSGIYGIDASTQTVANLLDTKIDNYVRINFSSFLGLVDAIDGITVANPVTFTTDDGRVFKKGNLTLKSDDALMFSRERHNLEGGDNDRGKNQERVVTAIFNKLMSPNVIYHYQDILNVIGNSIQTNIPRSSITGLINQQIDNGGSWKIESTAISGQGQTGGLPSYAMPGYELYMFVLDQASLQQTKERIKSNLTSV